MNFPHTHFILSTRKEIFSFYFMQGRLCAIVVINGELHFNPYSSYIREYPFAMSHTANMCMSERVVFFLKAFTIPQKKITRQKATVFSILFLGMHFVGKSKHVHDFMWCCYVMGDILKGLNTISFSAWNSTVNILWSNILWELNTIIWITIAKFFHQMLFKKIVKILYTNTIILSMFLYMLVCSFLCIILYF